MGLSHELVLKVFKAQQNIRDVLALASTCQNFRHIWLSNFRTIIDSVLYKQVCCYDDAVALVEAQRECETKHQQRGTFTSISDATDNGRASYSDFQLFSRQLLANNREIDWILSLAESHFIPSERRGKNNCDVHQAECLPHERERFARSFYFLRRCVLAQSNPSLQSKCQDVLERLSVGELYILWDMLHWLCEILDPEEQEKLGIWDNDPPYHLIGIQSTFTMPDWDQVRDMVTDAYGTKRNFGEDEYETRIYGPCDRCNKYTCGSSMPVKRFSEG